MDLNFLGMLIRGSPVFASELPRVLRKRGLRGLRDYTRFLQAALDRERILCHEGRYVINSFIPPVPSPGFRTAVRSQVNNFVLRDTQGTLPITAVVAVTSSCPCACWHCSSAGAEGGRFEMKDLRRVLAILRDHGVSRIELTGGEPLLEEGLEDVIEAFAPGLWFVLITSGYGLTLARAKALKAKGLWAAAVAFDHPEPESFDRMRGLPGAYALASAAIQNARRAGLFTLVHLVATRALIQEGKLEGFLKQLRALGAHEVRLMEPLPAGKLFEEERELLTPEERAGLVAFRQRSYRNMSLPKVTSFADIESEERFGCAAGVQHLYVNTQGDLFPCNFLPLALGNILRDEPAVLWGRLRRYFPFARRECFLLTHRRELRGLREGPLPFPWEKTREVFSKLEDGDFLKWR